MRRAFTLIELLVVIAIIAILAAILFPVFAQAKASAKITSTLASTKQLALGLQMYSIDSDDVAVPEYGYPTVEEPRLYWNANTWVGRTLPYIKSRSIFWDRMKAEPTSDTHFDPFYNDTYHWTWAVNLSLNTDGYSRNWTGADCENINWSGQGSYRSLTAFEDPAKRLALAPVRYANLAYGWMRFYGIDASWPTQDRYATGWSWYQLIFDARREYGSRFIGGYADGHAAKFGKEKFIAYFADNPSANEANTYSEYCAKMDEKQLWSFWGRPWSGD
jgi:prepilin-type N-terminal cleavage/methylation domain-containing protein